MRLHLPTELPAAHRSGSSQAQCFGFTVPLQFVQLLFWILLGCSILQQEVLCWALYEELLCEVFNSIS